MNKGSKLNVLILLANPYSSDNGTQFSWTLSVTMADQLLYRREFRFRGLPAIQWILEFLGWYRIVNGRENISTNRFNTKDVIKEIQTRSDE